MRKLHLARTVASGFGSGYAPKAPGTFGSLAAVVAWWGASALLHGAGWVQPYYYITMCFVLITTVAGFWSVREILTSSSGGDESNRSKAARDPQWIVIDEWAGMGVSLLLVSPESPLAVFVAFVLFRIFDASKFWLVGVVEQFPGAGGVMWDDLVAGAFACLGVAMFVSWF